MKNLTPLSNNLEKYILLNINNLTIPSEVSGILFYYNLGMAYYELYKLTKKILYITNTFDSFNKALYSFKSKGIISLILNKRALILNELNFKEQAKYDSLISLHLIKKSYSLIDNIYAKCLKKEKEYKKVFYVFFDTDGILLQEYAFNIFNLSNKENYFNLKRKLQGVFNI